MRTSKPKPISSTFWVVFALALIVLVAIFILNSGQRPIGEASVCFEVLTCEEGILYSDSCKKTAIGVCGEEEPLPPRTPSYNNPYLEEYYEEGDLMYAYDIDPEDDKSFLGPPPTVYPDGDDKSYLGPPEDDFFNRPDVISVDESEFYELPTSIDEESRIRSLDQTMYDQMMDTYTDLTGEKFVDESSPSVAPPSFSDRPSTLKCVRNEKSLKCVNSPSALMGKPSRCTYDFVCSWSDPRLENPFAL